MVNRITDLLETLAACLCAQIESDGAPATCFCGVIPGDAAIGDYAGDCSDGSCGMAWVRLVNVYPATTVGQPDESSNNCASMLGLNIEIGLMRCVSIGNEDGSQPDAGTLLAEAEQQHQDAMSMWRAVACCTGLTSKDYVLGSYVPMGPMGGYMGGSWNLSVMI